MAFSAKFFTEESLRVLNLVLDQHYEYQSWKPTGPVELKNFQKEVLSGILETLKEKQIASVEVFCAGGKTIISAFVAESYLRQGKKIVFISPKRDAFPHFEKEFKRVLHTLGMEEDLVGARFSTNGISAFPVDKQVLIMTPYDLVAPYASESEQKVIEETLKRTGLVIIDEVHRIPNDPENDTIIIGKVEPIIRNKAMSYSAHVLTMTGTHFRMDNKLPFGVEEPDIKKTCQDLILEGCLPNLHGFPVPIEIDIKKSEISKGSEVLHLKLARKQLNRYMGKVADVILKTVKMEREFTKRIGVSKPAGHAIFVGRQEEATTICNILNRRLGWEGFVAYVSDQTMSPSERQDILEKLKDGRLLGYATVMMGVESLDVPRLKYCHLVARITSENKLMQAVGRVMRLPPKDDSDCLRVKDKAIVIDYQVRKKKIIRLAMGIRNIARIGESQVRSEEMLIGGAIFKSRDNNILKIESITLEEEEEWLRKTKEELETSEKKQELLNMPIGCPRPSHKEYLGRPLSRWTNKGKDYDPIFDIKIRKKQPRWFTFNPLNKKKTLLTMPKGCNRPRGFLGQALGNYTSKYSSAYDIVFNNEIRSKHPEWFNKRRPDKNKKKILALPIGCDKPIRGKHPLGWALHDYINKKGRIYDRIFDIKIRKKQPHWFENKKKTKMEMLLNMKIGSKKPAYQSPLGLALRYSNPNEPYYNPKFSRLIRKRQPQWFIDSATETKKIILGLEKGCPRPNTSYKYYGCFCSYICKKSSSYDAVFDRKIRVKHPEWFKKKQKE